MWKPARPAGRNSSSSEMTTTAEEAGLYKTQSRNERSSAEYLSRVLHKIHGEARAAPEDVVHTEANEVAEGSVTKAQRVRRRNAQQTQRGAVNKEQEWSVVAAADASDKVLQKYSEGGAFRQSVTKKQRRRGETHVPSHGQW